MTRLPTRGRRLVAALFALLLGLAPAPMIVAPAPAHAQQDKEISVDPKSVSPTVSDLRPGFQFVPEKSEQREPVPGILVYEADFVRDQTRANFANGPIEVKSLVARTANSSQAAEQFSSSRQALTSASPAWVESTKVSQIGDEATGLSMEGLSSDGQPAVAHLYLFRRGAMVVGITVAGLTKPTRMAEAEAIAAVVLRKMDPGYRSAAGQRVARPLNARGAQPAISSGPSTATTSQSSGTGVRVRVANTGGTGLRLRAQPSLTAQIASRLAEGTVLEVVGDDRQADGLTWKNVRAPGDGRGWVAANYVVPVSGGSGSTSTGTPPSAARSTSTAPPPATSTTGESLKVEVSARRAKVTRGQDQTVDITVTRNGQPVAGAQVTVKTSPTGETPSASATDGNGKTSVSWKPTGSPGFIGVGVSAIASDGSAGVGGASFEITS